MAQPASTEGDRGEQLQRTKEHLRDLDNLLEQMLALPISDRPRKSREEAPAPAPRLPLAPRPVIRPVPWPPPAEKPDTQVQVGRVVTFVPAVEQSNRSESTAPPDEAPRLTTDDARVELLSALDWTRRERQLDEASLRALLDPALLDVNTPDGFEMAQDNMLTLVGHPVLEGDFQRQPPQSPSFPHRALFSINKLYDWFADTLWPFHGLLKWSGTRSLLGLIGLLLLAGSLVWLIVTHFAAG